MRGRLKPSRSRSGSAASEEQAHQNSLGLRLERGVIGDITNSWRAAKDQALKVRRGMAAIGQSRIALKTEPMIVTGFAKDDAARDL